MRSWQSLIDIVQCPYSGGALAFDGSTWKTYNSEVEYATTEGVPILRDGPPPVVHPHDHTSNPIDPKIWHWMTSLDGPVLFLGAGATDIRADNIIEVEFNRFRNTDIIADAHALPFKENIFVAAVALNVFEHLMNPARAASEIRRVLRPNGQVFIHTAFMQPLHEAPHHYYNATEFGVRNWFDDFCEVEAVVSDNFNPAYGLSWLTNELLLATEQCLGQQVRRELEQLTMSDIASFWVDRNENRFSEMMKRMPEPVIRRFAAGFQLTARKQA